MLFNCEDLRGFRDISPNIKDARLMPAVEDTIDFDLKPFWGTAFHCDFIANIDAYQASYLANESYTATTTQQYYLDLLNGKTYTDRIGHTIVYQGLKKAFQNFAFANYISFDNFRSTATGQVIKKNDYSEMQDRKEIALQVVSYKSKGNACLQDVAKFLDDNRTNYPLWRFSTQNKSMRSALRITAVDKTDMNLSNNSDLISDLLP